MAIMKLGDAGDEPLRRRDAMPLNAAGKIDKKALRAELSYTSRC
jgi:non-ribosomal peptide synthetase component E (peptide arylation enzyme)